MSRSFTRTSNAAKAAQTDLEAKVKALEEENANLKKAPAAKGPAK